MFPSFPWWYTRASCEKCNDVSFFFTSRPLYFQHDGHSRTIVGIQMQKAKSSSARSYSLLILDPAHVSITDIFFLMWYFSLWFFKREKRRKKEWGKGGFSEWRKEKELTLCSSSSFNTNSTFDTTSCYAHANSPCSTVLQRLLGLLHVQLVPTLNLFELAKKCTS